MGDDKELREAVEQLWDWQNGGDSFSAKLYQLISKADLLNKAKLRLGFPKHVEAFNRWQQAKSSKEFFEEYGVK